MCRLRETARDLWRIVQRTWCCWLLLASLHLSECFASEAADKLFYKLTHENNYNPMIRPVVNESDTVVVKFGLSVSQLIDIDEKNQIMTTSVWVKHTWKDYQLTWDPDEYDGIRYLHIPSGLLWLPDILLYNNADGYYDVRFLVNAIVHYDGTVRWLPPAIYKSSCEINIEFFPFDEQNCTMKFGPWTHESRKVDMVMEQDIVDQEDYTENGEWQIVESPGLRHHIDYPCCDYKFADVTFYFLLHRKPLFYIVTLVIPCILISFLTTLVFYLPADAQEKITLSISILLALIVFLLLIPSIIPPTSTTLPLIGRYMLFTMVLVTMSITATVIVINIHFRSARTHTMPTWVRTVFLYYLPKMLNISRPGGLELPSGKKYKSMKKHTNYTPASYNAPLRGKYFYDRKFMRSGAKYMVNTITPSLLEEIQFRDRQYSDASDSRPLSKECAELIDHVETIAKYFQMEDEHYKGAEDWKFVAMVVDRVFLWIFAIMCLCGSLGIILRSPVFWEGPNFHQPSNYTKPILLNETIYGRPDIL
ncbi:neuronal acetylcholine receptor subunit beta-4-like [Acanthaster planci]|uniref:Neuronal acetylcholine receptor subunit beta-4-like n=1 Tax=Acanthaster planci TaxID=133434 RepID=A0A8B7YU75_ACAPL|nr:neuronal acetylcholine receptor subunit beta-4-like [Acanthaster planci]